MGKLYEIFRVLTNKLNIEVQSLDTLRYVCVCVYVHICVCMYVCVCVCIYVCVYVCVYMGICVCVYMYVYMCVWVCVYDIEVQSLDTLR
jgi:hypothetical protein